jgi:cation transport ATPase
METLSPRNAQDDDSEPAPHEGHLPSASRATRRESAGERPRRDTTKVSNAQAPKAGAPRRQGLIACFTLTAIGLHLLLWVHVGSAAKAYGMPLYELPLIAALIFGGVPLVIDLAIKLLRREFSSDLLAGISIVTSVALGEFFAGSLVVLMLSGGGALEAYAVRSASSVLEALAKRMPSQAHRKLGGDIEDVSLEDVAVGDTLVVFPHESCPVDGAVVQGRGVMDESYLTG